MSHTTRHHEVPRATMRQHGTQQVTVDGPCGPMLDFQVINIGSDKHWQKWWALSEASALRSTTTHQQTLPVCTRTCGLTKPSINVSVAIISP
eukprot:scaffold207939_cov16-Tisochrysis_lutea.AAC.1